MFSLQESAVNDAWMSYGEFAEDLIQASPWAPQLLSDGGDVAMAVIWSLPQLAAACVGGVFALLVTLITRRFFGLLRKSSAEIEFGAR